MLRGRKPKPRGMAKRRAKADVPAPLSALPRCPDHLSAKARREWRRLATPLHKAGVLTVADRAALAAYCQCWARWAEAERRLAETPVLLRAPSGYVQQSPWLTVANKQLELMARYMAELGLTPSARMRVPMKEEGEGDDGPKMIFRVIYDAKDGPPDTAADGTVGKRGRIGPMTLIDGI